MLEHMVKLSKRGNSWGVSIPKPVLASMDWHVGSYIQLLVVDGGVLLVRPETVRSANIRTSPGKKREP